MSRSFEIDLKLTPGDRAALELHARERGVTLETVLADAIRPTLQLFESDGYRTQLDLTGLTPSLTLRTEK